MQAERVRAIRVTRGHLDQVKHLDFAARSLRVDTRSGHDVGQVGREDMFRVRAKRAADMT